MDLSDLTSYADSKYHIQEQYKWTDFPGFSVLADPYTGKWVALLMRQWDGERGEQIQVCDIKCGQECLSVPHAAFLSRPFRMVGRNWVGVRMNQTTQPEVVYHLFDQAIAQEERRGGVIVLEQNTSREEHPKSEGLYYGDTMLPSGSGRTYTGTVQTSGGGRTYADTALPFGSGYVTHSDPEIPEKILQMRKLYEYGDNSFELKRKNFYRQGKFMEDYEDDLPLEEDYHQFFPTYHDLTVKRLRGYFTWRTKARRGEFTPVATSLAYMYLYELLCGIGCSGPENVLEKLKEFETGFLDSGIGNRGMRPNLHRWMFEYTVTHDFPAETVRQYADQEILKRDHALLVLREPEQYTDEEVVAALLVFGEKKLASSRVLAQEKEKGTFLFARAWRNLMAHRAFFFASVFGGMKAYDWYPFANAIYWEPVKMRDRELILDACRLFHCRDGAWQEERYEQLYFDKNRLNFLFHACERIFRKELKLGHPLRSSLAEDWAVPYIEEAVAGFRREEAQKARPKVTIDFSDLDKIRQDAAITRESLLTPEEMDDTAPVPGAAPAPVSEPAQAPESAATHPGPTLESQLAPAPASEPAQAPESAAASPEPAPKAALPPAGPFAPAPGGAAKPGEAADRGPFYGLDGLHRQILKALISGQPVDGLIRENHLMAPVVTDTINEAFYEMIGDSILECDDSSIHVIEDYREDIRKLLEEGEM